MTWIPGRGFWETLTKLDTGEIDVILTPLDDPAEWARQHGYRVDVVVQDDALTYQILPGDPGVWCDEGAGPRSL